MTNPLKTDLLELLMPDLRFWSPADSDAPRPVTELPPRLRETLARYAFGGVILFRENLVSVDQIVRLTDALQLDASGGGRLIALDQEGGTVTRIPGGLEMPGNMALGAIDDPAATRGCARLLASELAALGFNFAFAPVLDVNSNPANPIVGVRSFGSDPMRVARNGRAYVQGLDDGQLAACGKHFPGHGDTATDSHHATPLIDRPRSAFDAVDLVPFRAVIADGIDALMTAHIVAPALDDGTLAARDGRQVPVPATLSRRIVTDLLRDELGYRGLVVSDALDMKGITDHFDAVDAAVHCLAAGVDILLMPVRLWSEAGILRFERWFEAVLAACEDEPALRSHVAEAAARVRALKARKVAPRLGQATPLDQRLAAARALVLCETHRQAQESLAARAITLVRHDEAALALPLSPHADAGLLLVAADRLIREEASATLAALGVDGLVVRTPQQVCPDDFESGRTLLLLTANLRAPEAALARVTALARAAGSPVVLLGCHDPYDGRHVEQVDVHLLAYGASGVDQTNYTERRFRLNVDQALRRLFRDEARDYQARAPVEV